MAVRKRVKPNSGLIRSVVHHSDLSRIEQIVSEIGDFLRWESRAKESYRSERSKAVREIGERLEEARSLLPSNREYGKWLKSNWGWSQSQAWNYIEGAKTLNAIESITKNKNCNELKPDGEGQLRELVKVSDDPKKRAEAWVAIAPNLETKKNGKPKSAAAIKKELVTAGFVKKQSSPRKKPITTPPAIAKEESRSPSAPNEFASVMEFIKGKSLSKAQLVSLSELVRQYADSLS